MSSPQLVSEFRAADRSPELDPQADADGPGLVRFSVVGELDLGTEHKLGEALAGVPSGTAVLILDLRELTFMDSTGLHLILSATARLAEAGCRLVLIPGGHQIQRIFEITGTKQHLEFVAAPNFRDPAIVPARTSAFLRTRFRLWVSASYVNVGHDDPAFSSAPARARRESAMATTRMIAAANDL